MTNPELNPIAQLNDTFRRHRICPVPGNHMMTPAVQELTDHERCSLLYAVATFDAFNEDNDPHGEHDFGSLDFFGTKWFWKIDYYADASCESGSENPASYTQCFRVLTIMQASEY